MAMNGKGQTLLFAFMMAVVIIVLALGISYAVRQGTDNAMNSMNCSTTTDDYVKAGCYTADVSPAYFIGGLIALAGVVLAAKYVLG